MIASSEKQIKTQLFQNSLRFGKSPDVGVTEFYRTLKEQISEIAMITVFADESVGLSQFTLPCMKFANNKAVENPLKFIEGLISKMFEFELAKAQLVDGFSIFN